MTNSFFLAKSGGRVLFSVKIDDVQTVIRTGFSISSSQKDLCFIDSTLSITKFNLSSVLEEGLNWVDLSLQISEDFIVQADCRLGVDKEIPYDPKAIMFQPLFLPECRLDLDTKGKNIHKRGFFSWWSGARNLSLLGLCDNCNDSFRLAIYDTGWAPEIYYYCEKGIHLLLAKPNREFRLVDASTHHVIEAMLPECNICGTNFLLNNSFRCLHCGTPYLNLEAFPEERSERYALSLYGEEYQRFNYYKPT